MNTQKFLVSGIVGGIVSFFAGYLIYGVLLMNILGKNQGSATGVMRSSAEMVWWSLMLGSLFMALTLSYIFNKLANISGWAAGAGAGAAIGFLMTAGYDLTSYGTSNLMNLTGTCIDIVGGTLLSTINGAAVGWMNGVGKKA